MSTWRPFVIVLALGLVVAANVALSAFEQVPALEAGPSAVRIDERLRHLEYLPTQRRTNFGEMGMDEKMADATAAFIERYASHTARLTKMLEEQGTVVGDALCPSDKLPQPYAMLEYLVVEENGKRMPIEIDRLLRFEAQPWFRIAPVAAVYETIERQENRPQDATLVAVSGLLVSREADLLDGRAPFSRTFLGSWGFGPLEKEHPRVRASSSLYFSLMHFLTELANGDNGICS